MAAGLRQARVAPTLAVTDIAKAREFYERVLGLERVDTGFEDEGAEVFRTEGGDMLYLYERPTPSGSTATACSFSVDNVEEVVAALRKSGVTFEEYDIPEMELKTENGIARTGDGMTTAWFKDPSGNIIAIDNMNAVMASRSKVPLQQSASTTEQRVH